jgi:HAD superfamily hydrolase (TIGR01509 family)
VLVARPVIFLDDGGVMNENERRAAAWRRLVGEFLAPRLGGEPVAWAKANWQVAQRLFAAYEQRLQTTDAGNIERHYWTDDLAWLREMAALVGVAAPAAEAECVALARQTSAYVTRRVDSAFTGASEAIRQLRRAGYRLYTASGERSAELDGYLSGMGVRDCFERLYGPDLIDVFKGGPRYYQRLLADAGVSPAEALIVDDSPRALTWARQAGARTVLVAAADAGLAEVEAVIDRLAELPALIDHLSTYMRWG